MSNGNLSWAEVAAPPSPHTDPAGLQAPPVPASVVTVPLATLRTALLLASATNSDPSGRTPTPDGALNRADAAGPSVRAAVPSPAAVEMFPLGSTRRTRLLT